MFLGLLQTDYVKLFLNDPLLIFKAKVSYRNSDIKTRNQFAWFLKIFYVLITPEDKSAAKAILLLEYQQKIALY